MENPGYTWIFFLYLLLVSISRITFSYSSNRSITLQLSSWLGLWETDKVNTPYHPSLRHIAFKVDFADIKQAKEWLEQKGILVRTSFGFPSKKQPLVLPNNPQAHAAIYFDDPDGNSIELITPLRLDVEENFEMMTLNDWLEGKKLSKNSL